MRNGLSWFIMVLLLAAPLAQAALFRSTTADLYEDSYRAFMKTHTVNKSALTRFGHEQTEKCDEHHRCPPVDDFKTRAADVYLESHFRYPFYPEML